MQGALIGGRYRIHSRVGEGGMASVYLAIDERLKRQVAIKILHDHMIRNQDIRKRFHLEAEAVSSLDHPNIVRIYDYSGESAGQVWIVTELINGMNLAQFLGDQVNNRVHPHVALCITREICKALEVAHGKGIVHRDIKPENVMFTKAGQIKLMDFGIAKNLQKTSMTQTGTFMGSPCYMSVEQVKGNHIDHRSDIYSLCVLFYELSTGTLPYTGSSQHEVVLNIVEGKLKEPQAVLTIVSKKLSDIIVKGLNRNPNLRFQSIKALAKELDRYLAEIKFAESHIELERFFKDRTKYLTKLDISSDDHSIQNDHRQTIVSKHSPDQNLVDFNKTTQIQPKNIQRHHVSESKTKPLPLKKPAQLKANFSGKPPVKFSQPRMQPKQTPVKKVFSVKQTIAPVVNVKGWQRKFALGLLMTLFAFAIYILISVMKTFTQDSPHQTMPKSANSPVIQPVKQTTSENRSIKDVKSNTPETKSLDQPKASPKELIKSASPTSKKVISKRSSQPKAPRFETPHQRNKIPRKAIISKRSIKQNREKPHSTTSGLLQIKTDIAAEIYLNGKKMGTTNATVSGSKLLSLPPASYRLELKRPGYKTYSENIRLAPGKTLRLTQISLEPHKLKNVVFELDRYPTSLIINNPKTKEKYKLVVTSRSNSLELPIGEYRVELTHEKQVIQKKLILPKDERNQYVFTAKFKK